MAEVTKRKIASIYSLITGLFLSLFSGHARAASFWDFFKPTTTTANKTTTTRTTTTNIVPQVGVMNAPAPTATTSTFTTVPTTGVMNAPAPSTLDTVAPTGVMNAPAPDSNQVLNSEFVTIQNVADVSMRNFISQKAVEQGKSLDQLSVQDFNTLRTDYLEMQVKALEEKLQQLNEQNLSH